MKLGVCVPNYGEQSTPDAIKRIAASGGATITISPLEVPPYGMSWQDDDIVFGAGTQGIMRVSANGGKLTEVVVTGQDGHQVAGQLGADGASWRSSEPLGYGKSYTARATAKPSRIGR